MLEREKRDFRRVVLELRQTGCTIQQANHAAAHVLGVKSPFDDETLLKMPLSPTRRRLGVPLVTF